MSQLRYLLVLSAMALTLVEQLTCHPAPWNLPQPSDTSDLHLTAPSKDNNDQGIEQVIATKPNDLTSLSLAPSKDTNSQGVEQVRTTQAANSNSVPNAASLDISDQTIEQVREAQSRKSTLLSTTTLSKDTSSPTRTTLSSTSVSVSSTQIKDTNGQATEKVRTIPAINPAPLSTTKDSNSQAIKEGRATELNSQAPLSTAQNKDIAAGLGTNDQAIIVLFSCPQTCQCESRQVNRNFTIRDCETDPGLHWSPLDTFFKWYTEVNIINAKVATYPCRWLWDQLEMITLRLWRNDIKTVSCNLKRFARLQFLDMAWNDLETVPDDILVTNLDTLSLSHNSIREVSPLVYQCAVTLDLSHNLIKDMPDIMSVTPHILHLNLSHNLFESMPCNLTTVHTLMTLDLGYNAIRSASCNMDRFENLWKLVLTHNQLTEVTRIENMLYSVTELDMSYNSLVSVSCSLLRINTLLVIDISHNALRDISCNCGPFYLGIEWFSTVRELNLAHNALNTVPCNFSAMIHLTMLNLSHNSLKNGGCNLSALQSLVRLDLSNNYLTMIPYDPSMMPDLNHLDLSCNQLVTVPSTLLMMPRLQNLKLSNNALKTFLNAPSMVPSLQWLDLSHNFLQTMPFGNTKFRSLKMLDLSRNSLQRLPDDIATVTLDPNTQLRLSGNPWICDCEGLTTRDWIVANCKSIQDSLKIRCNAPNVAKGRKIITTDTNIFCPTGMYTMIGVLIGVVTFLLACFPLICVIRIRNTVEVHERKAWEPINWDEAENEGKEFDVFVSYSNGDEAYVGEYLIPELEARGFKVCFHRVHFLGGKSIIDNICECIAKSKKVLVFYSRNFTKSNFGMYEFNMAMDLDAQNATNHLITIKDMDVDIQNLRITHTTYFRTHSYIIREEPRFWDNLVYTLPHHRLGTIEDPDDDN